MQELYQVYIILFFYLLAFKSAFLSKIPFPISIITTFFLKVSTWLLFNNEFPLVAPIITSNLFKLFVILLNDFGFCYCSFRSYKIYSICHIF